MCTTLREAVEQEAPLHQEGHTFDYALPLEWVVHFKATLGVDPVFIVWYYPPHSVFGEPYGVTPPAKALVEAYNLRVSAPARG